MKQFILSLQKRKEKEVPGRTNNFAIQKSFIRLPVEWQLLFALLLLMVLRLVTIVVFIIKQL
jgi:hypothetical protein